MTKNRFALFAGVAIAASLALIAPSIASAAQHQGQQFGVTQTNVAVQNQPALAAQVFQTDMKQTGLSFATDQFAIPNQSPQMQPTMTIAANNFGDSLAETVDKTTNDTTFALTAGKDADATANLSITTEQTSDSAD